MQTKKRLNSVIFNALLILALLIQAAVPMRSAVYAAPAQPREMMTQLEIKLTGLEDLGPNATYEGWVMVNGSPVSTGKFTVNSMGEPSQSEFTVPANAADLAAFILSIEPEPDPDPAPSMTKLVGGAFSNGQATLSTAHPAALGNDFTSAMGEFILAAPTMTDGDGSSYHNGIWWLNPNNGSPIASLDLPTLPAGWVYEGWVVSTNPTLMPMSTGTFTNPMMADSDGPGITAGANITMAPPFPGQDYINPPTNLLYKMAVISIEPSPDNSPEPFALKPLINRSIVHTGSDMALQMMDNMANNFPTGRARIVESAELTLQCNNLGDLGANAVYENWVIDNGMPVSAGRFMVDEAGNLSQTMFNLNLSSIANAGPYILTIEPAVGDDPAPSSTHYLGGTFVDGIANATIDHATALGTNFSTAKGNYILAAPSSTGTDGGMYYNGIWWLEMVNDLPNAGLMLPTLPAGWKYEGWVVVNGTPISTGTFTNPMTADSDMGGMTAGTTATPPFPGQDFIMPLTDLRNGMAVISVEPSPDNSPMPFELKPLVDTIVEDLGMGVPQPMSLNTNNLPTCSAELMTRSSAPSAVELTAKHTIAVNNNSIVITSIALGLAILTAGHLITTRKSIKSL